MESNKFILEQFIQEWLTSFVNNEEFLQLIEFFCPNISFKNLKNWLNDKNFTNRIIDLTIDR